MIPSLLYDSDKWLQINKEAETKLEKLQNRMFRYLFGVPDSTPKSILRFDLGNLSMREKIHVKRLNLLQHLKNLKPDSLGSEFYNLQVKYNFPGLVEECRALIKMHCLPDIIDENLNFSKHSWNQKVKKAIRNKSEHDIKKEFCNFTKLKHLNMPPEELKVQDYVKSISLSKARTMIRIRSSILPI